VVAKKTEVPWYWNLADELRSQRVSGDWFLRLVREAKARGFIQSWKDVSALARVDERAAELLDPPVVVDFLLALYSHSGLRRVLDPWAGIGITLWGLDDAGLVQTGVGIEINPDVHDLARELNPSARIRWVNDNAAIALPALPSDFDLVVGSPPMGLPPTTLLTSGTELRSSATFTMLVQASRQLGAEGQMAVILPESFFAEQAAPIHEALARGSVWPSASFALPARAFRTTVSTSVVVFERREPEALFVAELDPSVEIGALVSNFRDRRGSKVPQLGQLVARREFRTWKGYTRDLEILRLATEGGLRPMPLTQVCTAIRRARSDGTFVESPTSVYLPNIGTSRAATSVDELTVKPHNVLELEIDPSIADPSYVAGFFNSTLGRLVRDQWSKGTTIQHITLASARHATLYLPPSLEIQRRAVEVDRSLRELRRGVDALQRRVWEIPAAVGPVEQELRRLTEGDGLDRWMESLPFPLASILWQYHGADTAEGRCNFLVNFFEAATLFLVDLHWSALHEQMPIGSAGEGSESTRQFVTFERGSIGIWATLLAHLAKTARRQLSDQAPLALDLYRVRDLARLQGITDKSLTRALKEEAAQFRIDWVAHTAPASEGVWEQRLSLAEDTLTRIRGAIGEAFDGWRLVRTGAGRRRNGVVTTSTEDLTGSRTPFRRMQADLRELPEEGRLYMLEEGSTLPLELGPLVQLRRAPEAVEDACYFYDRIEGASVKFISYHYPHEPALLTADPSVVAMIRELEATRSLESVLVDG
jgi:hypothetical protein